MNGIKIIEIIAKARMYYSISIITTVSKVKKVNVVVTATYTDTHTKLELIQIIIAVIDFFLSTLTLQPIQIEC